ncbi:MAG TPA: TRAP transporter large permease [Kiloniellales bacterium]|nr:TRAP transporter large permease [Kiloniellales bacterium]
MIATLGVIVVVGLIVLGVPLWVGFVLGAALVLLFDMGVPLATLAQLSFASVESYPLLAAPFFVLSGSFLVRSGGMEPLQQLIGITIGSLRSGLPILIIVVGSVLGAISGSAAACLAILAVVVLPLFQASGYSRPYGAGLALVSAELGLIIPPSIFLILFGAANQVSIIDLFSGGLASGILIALCMIPIAVATARQSPEARTRKRPDGVYLHHLLLRCLPIFGFPVLVLGGIYGGLFSPTESASVAIFYALFLGVAVYRRLGIALFSAALEETARITGLIYMIVLGADLLARMLGYMQMPAAIGSLVNAVDLGPTEFMLAVVAFLLFLGLFFSSLPMVVTILPLFLPAAKQLGIDPVFFGVIGVICASFGEMTPPFGPQLWIAEPLCRVPMGQILWKAMPFLGAWVVALVILVLWPDFMLASVEALR